MNVIGSRPDGWWNDRKRAMREFASAVDAHAADSGRNILVVFDSDPGPLPKIAYIEVVIARRQGRNAADHEIEQLVKDAEVPTGITVVTSDRALMDTVTTLGAKVLSAGTFRAELDS